MVLCVQEDSFNVALVGPGCAGEQLGAVGERVACGPGVGIAVRLLGFGCTSMMLYQALNRSPGSERTFMMKDTSNVSQCSSM